jgi:hypothetical protein
VPNATTAAKAEETRYPCMIFALYATPEPSNAAANLPSSAED